MVVDRADPADEAGKRGIDGRPCGAGRCGRFVLRCAARERREQTWQQNEDERDAGGLEKGTNLLRLNLAAGDEHAGHLLIHTTPPGEAFFAGFVFLSFLQRSPGWYFRSR